VKNYNKKCMVGGVEQTLAVGVVVPYFQTEGQPWQGLAAMLGDLCLSIEPLSVERQTLVS
jgi:hypothetical protein